MHDDASTDVLHAELLPKLMTHREGYSWLNEFLDEQEGEGEGGREGGRGGGGREGTKGGGGRGKRRRKRGRGKGKRRRKKGKRKMPNQVAVQLCSKDLLPSAGPGRTPAHS